MKIGLLGFGVVGRGVYEITCARDDMQVTKVLGLEDIQLPDAEAVKDYKQILEDDSIDTVVEAMGGLHPAYEFVRAAIEAATHSCGAAEEKTLFHSQGDQLIIEGGNQCLVGSDDVLAGFHCGTDEIISRMQTAHGFHHSVDGLII